MKLPTNLNEVQKLVSHSGPQQVQIPFSMRLCLSNEALRFEKWQVAALKNGKFLKFIFKALSNEAKYEALIVGIRMAVDAGARNLIAYFNSQLITNQVEGTYEVKDDRMKEYFQEISEVTSQLKSFQLHIPHTKNSKTRYLARLIGTNWRKLVLDYLKEGVLPIDETKAACLRSREAKFALLDGILYKCSFSRPYL
ncbi:UNVERIFIED_CONTAM: hypothetical protein Scaly_2554500 [Sesamum calycinum]|uniref:RNase H type-1 domain-containing protein n=1 Tax=Sesamum calycinum TaxID=2727403 RepID=A0AAW2IYF2_9LAMI